MIRGFALDVDPSDTFEDLSWIIVRLCTGSASWIVSIIPVLKFGRNQS